MFFVKRLQDVTSMCRNLSRNKYGYFSKKTCVYFLLNILAELVILVSCSVLFCTSSVLFCYLHELRNITCLWQMIKVYTTFTVIQIIVVAHQLYWYIIIKRKKTLYGKWSWVEGDLILTFRKLKYGILISLQNRKKAEK